MRGLFKKAEAAGADCAIRCAALSERGLVRENNEDSHLEMPGRGIFCVADGMGGGDCGELASAWVCKEVYNALRPQCGDDSVFERMTLCEIALERANSRINEYARENDFRQMGSTAAIMVFDPDNRRRAAVCNVGDSRIYRLRDGRLKRLTRDHTVCEELKGLCALPPGDGCRSVGRSHPLAHVLTRAVGPTAMPRAEWRKVDVKAGDRYLICSDGVHDMLSDRDISTLLSEGADVESAAANIRQAVMAAGAEDNFTIVCLQT